MNRIVFTGIMPALVTPVNEDGTVKAAVLTELLQRLSQTGVTGFYLCGATGEGIAMDPARRMEVSDIAREATDLKLIDHIAAADLATATRLASHSRAAGMDGIASVPPFFYQYSQQGIIDYYKALSDASEGLPLLIYASPLSGAPLPIATIEKMLDIPGFVGMKYTNPNYFNMRELKKLDNGNINIINGPDETCLLGLMMGADGAIGSTYNNMPRTFVALYDAFKAGDFETALRLQYRADDAIACYLKYNVIACCKAALTDIGLDVGEPNAPLPRLTAEEKAAFLRELHALGYPEKF